MLRRNFISSGVSWLTTTTVVLSETRSQKVTEIVVKKSKRKLYLFNGDQIIRSYKIDLGFAPMVTKTSKVMVKLQKGPIKLIERMRTANIIYLSVFLIQTQKIDNSLNLKVNFLEAIYLYMEQINLFAGFKEIGRLVALH